MAKYIDADKILQKLPDDLPYKASVKRVLIQAPMEDVVEVKHGEWIATGVETLFLREFKCSRCSAKQLGSDNYCPNCGAKMDGERKSK